MSILSCKDWTASQIEGLFKKTDLIHQPSATGAGGAGGTNKILVNAFFEPSTRTALSFECAMKRLGGQVINFHKDTSSIKKGESYEDTIKTLSQYGDIMVLRHPTVGHVSLASTLIGIPIINGGDGAGEHPSQALLDLYTIYKQFGSNFATKRILFVGDLKNSRTIHSLILLVHLHPQMKIHTLAYPGLAPDYQLLQKISSIHQQSVDEIEIPLDKLTEHIGLFDVVYITRLQKERLQQGQEGTCNFMMTNELANQMKDDAIIMHPLPRNEEIHPEVDNNHRCHYFKQMKYGVHIRMALISGFFLT